jgi:hypothetical protein
MRMRCSSETSWYKWHMIFKESCFNDFYDVSCVAQAANHRNDPIADKA